MASALRRDSLDNVEIESILANNPVSTAALLKKPLHSSDLSRFHGGYRVSVHDDLDVFAQLIDRPISPNLEWFQILQHGAAINPTDGSQSPGIMPSKALRV